MYVLLQAGPADLGAADVRAEPGEGAGDGDSDPDPPSQEGVRGQGRGRVPHVGTRCCSILHLHAPILELGCISPKIFTQAQGRFSSLPYPTAHIG